MPTTGLGDTMADKNNDDAAVEELAKELYLIRNRYLDRKQAALQWGANCDDADRGYFRDKARAMLARFGKPSPAVSEEMIEKAAKGAYKKQCGGIWENQGDSCKTAYRTAIVAGFAAIGLIPPKPEPAQAKPDPEKVCRWTKDGEWVWKVGCNGAAAFSPPVNFCGYCGLPISRETVKPEPEESAGMRFAKDLPMGRDCKPASLEEIAADFDEVTAPAIELLDKLIDPNTLSIPAARNLAARAKAALELRGEAGK